MLQIKNLSITHKKDLRTLIEGFSLVLNDGDKAVMIGEEGDGKSTLLRWMYDPVLVEPYAEAAGERIVNRERLGFLPQELPEAERVRTVYEFFSEEPAFWEESPRELGRIAGQFHLAADFFYSEQLMGTLSGGEKVKAQMMRILLQSPSCLLLDEPSNDIDIETLEWMEKTILDWTGSVIFISHDETLIERTANMVVHLEQLRRKSVSRHTIARVPYRQYIEERNAAFEKQAQQARSDQREKQIRDEKYRRIAQRVEHEQAVISRANPSGGRLLKKKMHTVKALGRRFEREDREMAQMPEAEAAIFFKLGGNESGIPAEKNVLDYQCEKLLTPDGTRTLAEQIHLRVRGPEKLGITGKNGIGKTTLLRDIAGKLLERKDIRTVYMPQNYEDLLDQEVSPVDFLARSGEKEEITRVRTYLGSLKYTKEEMEHPIRELSGGQKAKVLLLQMSLSGANVLLLDEPTRNFSPLSGPVIRRMLKEFPGAIISVSHDRKYLAEVCTRIFPLK